MGMTGPIGSNRTATVRCNAPQRTPRYPDTPWGRLRGARGWSLRELEAKTGINAGVLSRIERGIGGATPDQARVLLAVFDGPLSRGDDD
jgi:hypothetical protein